MDSKKWRKLKMLYNSHNERRMNVSSGTDSPGSSWIKGLVFLELTLQWAEIRMIRWMCDIKVTELIFWVVLLEQCK